MIKLTLLIFVALPLLAFDTNSDIAKLDESLDAAYAARDTVALAKLLTNDFHITGTLGELWNLQSWLARVKDPGSPSKPADLKIEPVKTIIYGDTVLQIKRDFYTTRTGIKRQRYVNYVYVKQSGVWKMASQAVTIIAQ